MPNRKLTVVTYHYIRNLEKSRYPEIKGLNINSFRKQLLYFNKHYSFISIPELVDAIESGTPLPENSILLTFNDNYLDHFTNVFPILDEMNIPGCFYPEIKALAEPVVLPNHKIHYILASEPDTEKIIKEIKKLITKQSQMFPVSSFESYFDKLARPSKYDPKEVIFIKRLLQNELDEDLAKIFINHLFEKFVGVNDAVLNQELYMNDRHIQCMYRHGMHFGVIGYSHKRLSSLTFQEQKEEITTSIDYLKNLGIDEKQLTVSYPWNDFNIDTIDILKTHSIKAAFRGGSEPANLEAHDRYSLPRFDTNDFL